MRTTLFRWVAAVVMVSMIGEIFAPTVAFALTSGPNQPEFSSFEPVATTSMVNEFSGSFNYNLPVISIPGPNGVGYALSLSYHNATSVEEEASWVGLGWTLNPGSIIRQTRGFPDDYKDAKIQYWNKVRSNWTATATKRLGVEVGSTELEKNKQGKNQYTSKDVSVSASAYTTQRYNNYRGYGYTSGISLGVLGVANIDWTETDGKSSFGVSISPIAILSKLTNSGEKSGKAGIPKTMDRLKSMVTSSLTGSKSFSISTRTGLFGLYQFGDYQQSLNSTSYSGETWFGGLAAQCDLPPNVGLEGGIGGSYAVQTTKDKEDRRVFGYMYSRDAGNASESLMDYYAEKDAPYHKRDRYLYLPFSNADQFIVTGEGLGGGFRMHQRYLGQYRPNRVENESIINNFNLDFHFCSGFGAGLGIGHGDHSTTVKSGSVAYGDANEDNTRLEFGDGGTEDEPVFFRFAGDQGGSLLFADDDDAVMSQWVTTTEGKRFSMNGNVWRAANNGTRIGRSAYIGYTLNRDIRLGPPYSCQDVELNGNVNYKAYAKQSNIQSSENYHRITQFVDQWSAGGDAIGEFGITKEDGTTYNYGLPVYSTYESNFQFGLAGLGAGSIEDNYVAYKYVDIKNPGDNTIVGQMNPNPYAASYLLTEILAPDFVDRTSDGPTSDDLGGYVKFNYTQVAGTTRKSKDSKKTDAEWEETLDESWYRWRTPYRGLLYRRNEMSDPFDDVGTVNSGYKEIYYLASIETKTHKAVFVTSPRRDGYSAEAESVAALESLTEVSSSTEPNPAEQKQLMKLDKIELYAKDADGEPSTLLQTVNFEYDYSLCPGVPNAESENEERLGKLTLKRVWFEYQGAISARISPYEFGYEYKGSDYYRSLSIPQTNEGERYEAIVEYADGLIAAETSQNHPQNPAYSPFDIDRWGNYQKDGEIRHRKYQEWVNQAPADDFDPAAWQLKTIRLPSGGEIHVQYEQHDYRYVQHKGAMVMAGLEADDADPTDNVYYLNCADLGLDNPTEAELQQLKDEIEKRFITEKEFIYFRFLYSLSKGRLPQNDDALDQCQAEYITGYAAVKEVALEGSPASRIKLTIGESWPTVDRPVTGQLCLDYLRANRAGIVQIGDCNASNVGLQKPENSEKSVGGAIGALFLQFGDTEVNEDEDCRYISFPNSYLRVPIVNDKLGGGIRVKRLLMVDAGLEGGEDAALYGTEYEYRTADNKSSGVATNEPTLVFHRDSITG